MQKAHKSRRSRHVEALLPDRNPAPDLEHRGQLLWTLLVVTGMLVVAFQQFLGGHDLYDVIHNHEATPESAFLSAAEGTEVVAVPIPETGSGADTDPFPESPLANRSPAVRPSFKPENFLTVFPGLRSSSAPVSSLFPEMPAPNSDPLSPPSDFFSNP